MADVIHQFLIFRFIYNGNNLIPLLHIVGTDGFVNGSSAVKIIYDKLSECFFFSVIMQTLRLILWLKIK